MLILSTTPNSAYLLHLAEHRLQSNAPVAKEAIELAVMAGTAKPTWELRFRIANLLAAKGNKDKAKEIISGIDVSEYVHESNTPGQVKLLLSVLVMFNRIDEALKLLESANTAKRITIFDDFDIRLRIANALINDRQTEKAKNLLDAIDVNKAYAENPDLKNGYARVSWARYIPEDMAYEKVIPYLEKDARCGRLEGEWQLNFAQALMVVGREDEAEKLVEDTYRNDRITSNGFARCGFLRYFNFNYEPEKALSWFDKDLYRDRISGMWLIYHATALAAAGNIDDAMSMVEHAYKRNAQLVNGYALIAWYGYIIRNYDPKKALSTFKKDQQLHRINSGADNYLFGIHTYLGNRNKAERMVKISYEREKKVLGSYTLIGFWEYLRNGNLDYLISMVKKDEKLERLRLPLMNYIYAAVLLKCRKRVKARLLINNAARRSSLSEYFAKAWFKRVVSAEETHINEFITSELEAMFAKYQPLPF
jgi:hypothetical protein